MRKIIALSAIAACCLLGQASYGQNVEGQIVAAQFGTYQVPGIASGSLNFEPASCQVTGGGKNFAAFTTGVPIKIVDSNPALDEVQTPSAVFINGCSVSMATTYLHNTPFYLTSGTGGLQEALINGPAKAGGPNTVILNADWYAQVKPSNPATVIAAVKGNTSLGLVDVTTTPYTYYDWNGTNYVAIANGGGATLPNPGIVYGTSPTGGTVATSAQIAAALNISPTTPLVAALIPLATNSTVGAVKGDGTTTSVAGDGTISSVPPSGSANKVVATPNGSSGTASLRALVAADLPVATSSAFGAVKPDNTTVTISGGVISSVSGGGGGTPCTGVVNGIQYNNAGSFGCNAALTFDPSTAALTIGSPTPSILGTNSGPMTWTTPYNTGSGTALDTYQAYIQIGSGVNPFSNLVFNHTSGSPGGGEIEFAIPSFFTNGIVAQSGGIQDDDLTPSAPSVCTDGSSKLTTSGCSGGGGGGGITPQTFGGFGDAATIGNGCTTNGTTTIVCPAAPFSNGDVGKLVCVQGAGAAGIGFCSAIATVTSNTTVVVSATPSTNVTTAPAVFGHDDVVAIQDCFNYSGAHNTQCVLAPIGVFVNTSVGYLVYSAGLTIPTHANITGGADYGGTTIFSEFNGDLLSLPTSTASLAAGQPVSGVTFANIDLIHDPSWPNGRGIHLNSAPGIFGFGGMYYSTFTNVSDQSAALEALWMEGHLNSNNNPNQYITFNNFIANGPNQSHPANEIKITGIQAQIIFENGAINGTSNADYPNPLISITEETTGQADSPVDIKFFGYTYEVGTQGLYVGNGTSNIHFDNGYIEAVESPLIVESNVQSLTFRGNHIANSGNVGAVAQFSSSSSISATLQDNYVYGSTAPAAFAVCSGGTNNFNIDFLNNNSSLMSSANCATNHEGTGAALFQAFGTTDTVDASSTVITTIRNLNIQPGKTLTLKALSGGVGSFSLGTGGTPSGNDYPIDIGTFTSPLVVTAGNSITLALLDASGAPVYTVVGGTSLPATLLVSSETLASSANPIYSVAVNTTYVTLGGDITGPTMAAGADGQHKTLCFKQGAGPFTVASPTNVHGFFTVGVTNGDYNCQSFVYNAANSIWLADSPGVINQ